VLAFDNDAAGREGVSRAVEAISRSEKAPVLRVLEPGLLANTKDPDPFVRSQGVEKLRELIDDAGCAIAWRAHELVRNVTADDRVTVRRAALARAGRWLGSLPPRFALEHEDAVRCVAERCGYSEAAVSRAFRARYWGLEQQGPTERRQRMTMSRER